MLAIPYLVAYAAYCTPRALRRLTGQGDVSYGVYVYAFPIQQALVATLGPISPVVLAVIAAPLVWLAGFASWRLVERPMLRRKQRASRFQRRGRSKKDALSDLDAAAVL